MSKTADDVMTTVLSIMHHDPLDVSLFPKQVNCQRDGSSNLRRSPPITRPVTLAANARNMFTAPKDPYIDAVAAMPFTAITKILHRKAKSRIASSSRSVSADCSLEELTSQAAALVTAERKMYNVLVSRWQRIIDITRECDEKGIKVPSEILRGLSPSRRGRRANKVGREPSSLPVDTQRRQRSASVPSPLGPTDEKAVFGKILAETDRFVTTAQGVHLISSIAHERRAHFASQVAAYCNRLSSDHSVAAASAGSSGAGAILVSDILDTLASLALFDKDCSSSHCVTLLSFVEGRPPGIPPLPSHAALGKVSIEALCAEVLPKSITMCFSDTIANSSIGDGKPWGGIFPDGSVATSLFHVTLPAASESLVRDEVNTFVSSHADRGEPVGKVTLPHVVVLLAVYRTMIALSVLSQYVMHCFASDAQRIQEHHTLLGTSSSHLALLEMAMVPLRLHTLPSVLRAQFLEHVVQGPFSVFCEEMLRKERSMGFASPNAWKFPQALCTALYGVSLQRLMLDELRGARADGGKLPDKILGVLRRRFKPTFR